MLASRVWNETIEQLVSQGVLPTEIEFGGATLPTQTLSLDLVLNVLGSPLGLGFIQDTLNQPLKELGNLLKMRLQVDDQTAQLLVDVFGATVDLLNAVPLTFGDPHNNVVMPIQGEKMPLLVGEYGIRALGFDNLFNVSSHTPPTRLKIVAPEYDSASVTAAVIGDCNGDGDTDDPIESGSVDDLTIYKNTTDNVVLTVTVNNRTTHPATVAVQYMDASGTWQNIGELDLAEAETGATFEVAWNVADFDALVSAGNTVAVRAVATNALQLTDPDPVTGTFNLDADICPLGPEVVSLTVDAPTVTNPDSGAPQGTITLNAYTPVRTSPPINSIRLEAKGPQEAEWVAEVSETVTQIEGQELANLLEDLVKTTGVGKPTVQIDSTYQKWVVSIDTTALEDTITADSPAARDATKDENQYVVRAFINANGTEVPPLAGVTATFSVDNVDDVVPLGPTNIVAVADAAGAIDSNEDGSYTVGGIVDESVPSPIAMLTVEPTAAPATYADGSIRLVQMDADGNQITADSESGVLEAPTVDVGMLENGTYTFHALVIDKSGNVQADDSETDGSKITVHVLNFRVADIADLAVIAVDGVDKPESPGEPIPLRDSLTVSFTVANGSLAADQLSAAINGSAAASESAEDPENTFSLKVMELSALPDGMYTPDGMVTQRNGAISFPLAMIHLDNTGPTVAIEAPLEGHTVDSLPTVHATYNDGEGSGVDGGTGEVALTRIQPPDEAAVDVDQTALEKDATTLVYTRSEQLPGGAYRVTVKVADILGNVGEASVEFAISGTIPTVAIQSPTSGQTFEHGQPLISGEFSGAGTLEVTTFTVDGADATPEVDGNRFSYTPEEALTDGEHTVAVEVTDGNGKTAQTSVTFTVAMPKDTTPPVISEVAPTGLIKGDSWITLSAVVTDEQSSVVSVKFGIDDKPFRSVALAQIAEGRVQVADSFTAGTHTVKLVAISEGGTTEHSWTFTLVVDNVAPTITSITPSGTIRGGLPTISASANDESGVDEMDIVLMDSDGKEVKGDTEDDGEDDVEGITRLDFIPEKPLDEGVYSIEVRATDTIGNSATAKGSFTIDFDTAAPVITMATPQQDARLTERRPTISITYADAESGVDVDSIRFVLDDQLINLSDKQKSASQVTYIPVGNLSFGQHTVKLEVSDRAHEEGNVSEKNSGARKANMAVYEFSFFVESEEGPVLASRPINAPNPFKENTRISFTLTRQSTVSIVIYDITLRPVRVLVDNEVWDAGEYTGKNAIGWDGTTTGGEDLARGIYFCQIMVADSFEPEYAILKLALTR